MNSEDIKLLYGEDNENIVMNKENSAILLNILWAFGLSNKNKILEEGPMVDENMEVMQEILLQQVDGDCRLEML